MKRIVAVLVACGALVIWAAPAGAHASLERTTPESGAQLERAPESITLTFTEAVDAASGSVRIFNARGERLDGGRPTHPGGVGSRIAVPFGVGGDGAYVVTWRVVSADSHPVQGAFTFVVGDAEAVDDASIASLLRQRGGSRLVGVAYAASRALAFGSMLLLVGGAAFLLLVWPDGRAQRGVRRALGAALAVLAVTSATNFVLQGLYAAGLGLSDAASVVGDVAATRFGRVYLWRFALLVVALPLLAILFRRAPLPRWWFVAAGGTGLGIVATPGVAGHAAVGSHQPFALIADIAHVGAASVWLGGLVVLGAFVLPRRLDDLTQRVRRYSEVAFWAVATLVATGVFQSFRQVGSVDALTTTPYGTLLIVKSALVAGVLGVAWVSRRAAQTKWSPDTVGRVRTTVGIETVAAVAVLAVTSLLVNAVPAKTLAASPQSGELASATLLVDYTVSPGRAGENDIHLYTLTPAGQARPVEEMTLAFSLPGRGIAKIPIELEVAGPNHYQALDFDLPIKGRWRIDLAVRTSDVDQQTFEGAVEIR